MTKSEINYCVSVYDEFKKSPVTNRLFFLIYMCELIDVNFDVKSIKQIKKYGVNIKKLIYRDYVKDRKKLKINFLPLKTIKPTEEYNKEVLTEKLNAISSLLTNTLVNKLDTVKRLKTETPITTELRQIGRLDIMSELQHTLTQIKKINKK